MPEGGVTTTRSIDLRGLLFYGPVVAIVAGFIWAGAGRVASNTSYEDYCPPKYSSRFLGEVAQTPWCSDPPANTSQYRGDGKGGWIRSQDYEQYLLDKNLRDRYGNGVPSDTYNTSSDQPQPVIRVQESQQQQQQQQQLPATTQLPVITNQQAPRVDVAPPIINEVLVCGDGQKPLCTGWRPGVGRCCPSQGKPSNQGTTIESVPQSGSNNTWNSQQNLNVAPPVNNTYAPVVPQTNTDPACPNFHSDAAGNRICEPQNSAPNQWKEKVSPEKNAKLDIDKVWASLSPVQQDSLWNLCLTAQRVGLEAERESKKNSVDTSNMSVYEIVPSLTWSGYDKSNYYSNAHIQV